MGVISEDFLMHAHRESGKQDLHLLLVSTIVTALHRDYVLLTLPVYKQDLSPARGETPTATSDCCIHFPGRSPKHLPLPPFPFCLSKRSSLSYMRHVSSVMIHLWSTLRLKESCFILRLCVCLFEALNWHDFASFDEVSTMWKIKDSPVFTEEYGTPRSRIPAFRVWAFRP